MAKRPTISERGVSPLEIAKLRERFLAEEARRTGQKNFASFVKQAWAHTPQSDPLEWNWHLDAICMHLESVARGEISNLVINIGPGHAKSILMAVLWPAWVWTWWPRCQFIFASYAEALAVRDSVRCRAVIESEWYVKNFSSRSGWEMRRDQNAKGHFVNTLGGERFSTGIGGTGRRAHIIGIDDPIDASERHSKAARDSANEWIGNTISQRFVDPKQPRVALIMQRLHQEDPAGYVLAGGGWEHLMLPSEYEPQRKSVTHRKIVRDGVLRREKFWEDPRTVEGDLLFPQRFSKEVLERYKKPNELGAEGFAGQHQQNPTPSGGGIFAVSAWRYWTSDEATLMRLGYAREAPRPRGAHEGPPRSVDFADLEEILLSVDPTFHETQSGSYVAIHVWGKLGARRLLLDRVHKRMDFTETVQTLLHVIERWPRARRKLIEGKANGDAIISTLERAHGIIGLEAVKVTGSKLQRAHAGQPYQSAGNVELPNGAPWLEEYIAEHAAFPRGLHDDDVDAQSQALAGFEALTTTAELWAMADID